MSKQRKRVLVTGGAGFIGSHVCDAFVAEDWSVTALDDLSSGREENLSTDVELVVTDIRSPEAAKLVRDGAFDLISHHAAQIDVRVSVDRPDHDASINIMGLLNLLEAAVKGGVRRFLYVSSGGVVYGEPDEFPVPETAPKRPLSPYGVSKLAGEHYLHFYREIHGLEGVSLRYSNVFGPRQDPHGEAGVVAIFARCVLEGRTLTVYGDGEQTRDYVYVGDVAKANLLAALTDVSGSTGMDEVAFNVGTGVETSVNELARAVMRVAGRVVPVEHAPARAGELQRSCLDSGRLAGLDWRPAGELEDGLAATYAWIAGEDR
ncbi:MAG: NAD-dependent epimerase/dehydratase family protein [Candidatus Palauibacterales bacterium]|nr:NAD-dependent epimerase/dehydratase family protein [Candidatus Palauibacterales bacterium]MDP2481776.1 NAD-dependent epimerase/dehydratase family protein [Candidatus Palauibacterales bacterium]